MDWYKVTFKALNAAGQKKNLIILVKAVNYIDAETTASVKIEEYFFETGEIINITKTTIQSVVETEPMFNTTDYSNNINFLCKLRFSSISGDFIWNETVIVNADSLENAVKKLKEFAKEDKTVSEIYSIITTTIDNIFLPEETEE